MDINQVKKLREQTGAGMLECKKALEQANGSYEDALATLSKHTEKSAGNLRVASKGLCGIETLDNEAILYELNAETDFVAKNEHFVSLVKRLGEKLIETTVTNPKDALKITMDDQTVSDVLLHTSVLIKENIILRRFYRVVKTAEQTFGTYVHMGGKVVTLVILDHQNQTLADGLALQVAANAPLYLSVDQIDQDTLNYEQFMYEKNHGHFNQQAFDAYLKEVSLYTQPYVKDPEKTVESLLKENQVQVIDFFRFELGQGIENKLNCKLDIPCDGSKITVTPIL